MHTVLVGQSYSEDLLFSDADVLAFAELTGDHNPIHFDDQAAQAQGFPRRILHGLLVTSAFGRILGTRFPGKGTIYLRQSCDFRAPMFSGEPLRATITVSGKKEGKPIYFLTTEITSLESRATKVTGEAVVKWVEEPG